MNNKTLPVEQVDIKAAQEFIFLWNRDLADRDELVRLFAKHRIQVAEAVREACAKVCEDQARDFLSSQYATPQPIGSIQERFACRECASAIRNLDLSTIGGKVNG